MNIGIVGATGYGGADLIRILHQHPEVNIVSVHSSSQDGTAYEESYPHLNSLYPMNLEAIDVEQMAKKLDLVFLATPSGISSKLSPQLHQAGLKVIDLSGDLRIKQPDLYKQWYKKDPAEAATLDKAVYGLSEWFSEDVKNATLIANPGCYPTAVLLGLAPVIQGNLINANSLIIDAKSGASGAGRNPLPIAHLPEANDNFRIYKVNQHQHIPEIEQQLSLWNDHDVTVSFSTHLVPMTRGIMATMYAEASENVTAESLHKLYTETYANSPFVRVRKLGTFPSTKEVYASNYCDIGITYDERTNRIMIISVIDNLMKGAAGQAVQNLNIMMGLEQTTGLNFIPVYP